MSHPAEPITFSKDVITVEIESEPQTSYLSIQTETNNAETQDDYISAHNPKPHSKIITNLDKTDFDVETKIPVTQSNKINSVKYLPTSTSMASQRITNTRENSPKHHALSPYSRSKGIRKCRNKEVENRKGPEITNELEKSKLVKKTSGYTSNSLFSSRPHNMQPIIMHSSPYEVRHDIQKDINIAPKSRPVEETASMTDVVGDEETKIYGDAPPPPDHLG